MVSPFRRLERGPAGPLCPSESSLSGLKTLKLKMLVYTVKFRATSGHSFRAPIVCRAVPVSGVIRPITVYVHMMRLIGAHECHTGDGVDVT